MWVVRFWDQEPSLKPRYSVLVITGTELQDPKVENVQRLFQFKTGLVWYSTSIHRISSSMQWNRLNILSETRSALIEANRQQPINPDNNYYRCGIDAVSGDNLFSRRGTSLVTLRRTTVTKLLSISFFCLYRVSFLAIILILNKVINNPLSVFQLICKLLKTYSFLR